MNRRKMAVILALAMTVTAAPVSITTVQAEEYLDGFVDEAETEILEVEEETTEGDAFSDVTDVTEDDFVSEEGETEQGMISESEASDLGEDDEVVIEDYRRNYYPKMNEQVVLNVTAYSANGNLTYQWQIEDLSNVNEDSTIWLDIPGANNAEYVIEHADKTVSYRCVVSNGIDTAIAGRYIEIDSGLAYMDDEVQYFTVKPGENVEMTAKAETTSGGELTYEWIIYNEENKCWEKIDGAESDRYVASSVSKNTKYRCRISDGCNRIYQEYYVNINSGLEAAAVGDQVIYVEEGDTPVLKVSAKSNYPLQYQWEKTTQDIKNVYKPIEGATESEYQVTPVQYAEEYYSCHVTDGYNETWVLFKVGIQSGLTATADSIVWASEDGTAELKVTASTKEKYGPTTYQWGIGWRGTIDGATDSTYVVKDVTAIREYYCKVSDRVGSTYVTIYVAPKELENIYPSSMKNPRDLDPEKDNIVVSYDMDEENYFRFVPKISGLWRFTFDAKKETYQRLYNENWDEIEDYLYEAELVAGKTYYIECGYEDVMDTGYYHLKAEYVDSCNHKWDSGKVTREATCTTEGETVYTCETCGKTKIENGLKEHQMVTKVDKEATCGTAGSQHKECSVCGLKEAAAEIPATGKHTMKTIVDQAATCGAAGSQHNECTVCGLKEAATAIPATGNHTYGEYVVTKEATAVAEGTKVRTCSVCGATDSAVIAKIPGTIKAVATKVPLQLKKSVALSKLVTGLAAGDSIDVAACTSSKPSIAAIDKSGKVTAKKAGTTVVTIKLASGVSTNVTVTVQKKAVATTAISISKTLKLTVGDKQTLAPVISPITTLDKVTYTTSNSKIVSVTKSGAVTAKKAGTATIKVKSGKKTVSIKVTVVGKAPTGMTGVAATKTLKKGKSFTIKAKLTPSGADAKITYKSSNSKVASVSAKGKVTAKKKGTATITVKAGNITKTCVVTVK